MNLRRKMLVVVCLLLSLSFAACGTLPDDQNPSATPFYTPNQSETASPGASLPGTDVPTATPDSSVGYQPQGEANYTVTLDPNVEYWDYPVSKVGHVFTHSLIAYLDMTDLATNPESYWRNECVTVSEFKRFLESVYEKDFILINMNYIYEYKTDSDGVLRAYLKDTIKLPKGKKGLILSVDDLTYSPYQHLQGRVDRLEVYKGRIASATELKDGTIDYSYDKEVVPIVEQFCLQHPDFSFAGAKCMLAVNGRHGLLGYRTADAHKGTKDYSGKPVDIEAEKAKAKVVVDYLKANGFYFGCHGYAHVDINTLSGASLDKEFNLYNNEVKSLIGYTPIYVYPLGAYAKYGTEQHNRLLQEGFHVFCGTSMWELLMNGMPGDKQVGNIFNQRCILQGKTLLRDAQEGKEDGTWFWKYCDPYEVYDNSVRYHQLVRPS